MIKAYAEDYVKSMKKLDILEQYFVEMHLETITPDMLTDNIREDLKSFTTGAELAVLQIVLESVIQLAASPDKDTSGTIALIQAIASEEDFANNLLKTIIFKEVGSDE